MRTLVLALIAIAGFACTDDDKKGPFGGGVPGTISQAVTEGGPNPAQIIVPLTNNGTCTLNFSRTIQTVDGAAWLSATPISGAIMPSSMTPMTITLDVIAPALLPGTYTGTIVLTGTCATTGRAAAGSPISIAVNLTVTPNLAGIAAGDETITQDPTVLANTWSATSMTGAPPSRLGHGAVWTGAEMIVWGGQPDGTATYFNSGGRYEPINNVWTPTSTVAAPSPRTLPLMVWTGSRMIVWGGQDIGGASNTGGVYVPSGNTWTATAAASAPPARVSGSAIWAGGSIGRMIVWGGSPITNTGGRYDPIANNWLPTTTVGAPTARMFHSAVWTGTRMLVWGGLDGAGPTVFGDGAGYNPVADTWSPITQAGAPSPRYHHRVIWTGSHMVVWGGRSSSTGASLADGALYDPVRDLWIALNQTNAPGARESHVAVWTGSEMVVFGGDPDGVNNVTSTGGRYDPDFDAWTATSTMNVTATGFGHTSIWTGTKMLVWGGITSTGFGTGQVYQ